MIDPKAVTESFVATLNRAFAADPVAIASIVTRQVPCNRTIVADPTVMCVVDPEDHEAARVGMMGVLNSLLADLGAPLVAYRCEPCEDSGQLRVTGFEVYSPEPQAEETMP